MGFLFLFIVDFRSCSSVLPFTPYFICTSLRFGMVGILSSSLTVGAELSKPFAKYISVAIVWFCQGTLRLVTSAPRFRFTFGKASAALILVGRLKCSDCPSSSHPPPSTLLVFVPLRGYSYTHPPLPTPAAGTLLLLSRARSSVAIQKPASVTPVLLAIANAALVHAWRALTRVASIHHPILPSGTSISRRTASVCRSILSLPSSG